MGRKSEIWKAPAAALKNMPDVSGNTVNGLGEKERRRPSPFFWHDPRHHEFGDMQRYTIGIMYGLDGAEQVAEAFSLNPDFRPGSPEGTASSRQFVHRGPEPIPVAPEKTTRSPESWSKRVKGFALSHSADLVGIAEMQRDWIYEGFDITEKFVVVLGVAHDYEELSQAPPLPGNHRALVEIGRQYTRGATAAAELTNFIRSQGHLATSHPGPTAESLAMTPAAIAAGLGELGKHGSLINRRYGSAFRLAAVSTDMPLVPDGPDEFGADEFCQQCQVCTDACPPDAIYTEKQWVRGAQKWYVDFDKCIPYFAEARGCGICIAVCPWSRPGVADRLLTKMARRKEKRRKETTPSAGVDRE